MAHLLGDWTANGPDVPCETIEGHLARLAAQSNFMTANKPTKKAGKDDEPVVIETKPGHHKDIGGGEAKNGTSARCG